MRKAKVEYKKVIALIFLKEEFEIKWLPLAWEIKYWERVRMMVVVCFRSVQKELKNDVVAHRASTEVPCCAMGVPGRAEQDWALSAAGPSQSAPAPSLGQGVRRPQPGWSRAGLPGEAGPACRPAVEPGAEAAMFGRGRSSRPCLSGSASPLCSSHYCSWEDFPLTPAVCPHLAVTSVLARFGFFFLSELEVLLHQECCQAGSVWPPRKTLQMPASA